MAQNPRPRNPESASGNVGGEVTEPLPFIPFHTGCARPNLTLRFDYYPTFDRKALQFVQSSIDWCGLQRKDASDNAGQIQRSGSSPFEQLRQFLREVIRDADDFGFL